MDLTIGKQNLFRQISLKAIWNSRPFILLNATFVSMKWNSMIRSGTGGLVSLITIMVRRWTIYRFLVLPTRKWMDVTIIS